MKELTNYINERLSGLVSDVLFESKKNSLIITVYTKDKGSVLNEKSRIKRYLRKKLGKSIIFQVRPIKSEGTPSPPLSMNKQKASVSPFKTKVESMSKSSFKDRGVYIKADQPYLADCLYKVLSAKKVINEVEASLLIIVDESLIPRELNSVCGKADKATPVVILSFSSLKSLQRRLSGIHDFPELRECVEKGLVLHFRLPIDLHDVNCKISELHDSFLKQGANIAQIQTKVAERLRKRQDELQRHKMKNLMAAARILNGALGSLDYDLSNETIKKNAETAYRDLIYKDSFNNWNNGEKKELFDDALRTIERSEISFALRGKRNEIWHRNISKILVVDDQLDMWRPVWEFIFGKGKIDIVDNGIDGLKQISSNNYDFVFLDMDLGDGRENGIEVLQRIKKQAFDLPVILLTAYDDVEVTKAGLHYGASDYFVKEMVDTSDRDSAAYYTKLKEIILNEDYHTKSPIRQLWQKYKNLEKKIAGIDKQLKTAINQYIRRAFFFLNLDHDFLLPKALLLSAKRDNLTDAVLNIESAFKDALAINHMSQNRFNLNVSDIKSNLFETSRKDAEGRKRYPTVGEISKSLIDEKNGNRLDSIFRCARHAKKKITKKIDVVNCIDLLFNCVDKTNFTPNSYSAFVANESSIPDQFELSKLPCAEKNFSSHEEYGRLGAQALLSGFKETRSNKIAAQVLFIDDEGKESPWDKVLNEVFTCVKTEKYPINIENYSFQDYSFIFLDLKLDPKDYKNGCRLGLKTLDEIKKKDFTIPVVMLTASNSSMYTKKALLHGAIDYITKGTHLDDKAYWDQFNNSLKKILKIGETEREIWENLLKVQKTINIFSKENAIPIDKIIEGAYSPLKAAYFNFILISRKSFMPDAFAVRELVSIDGPENDFYLQCGRSLEGLINILTEYLVRKREDAGKIVNDLCAVNGKKIWEERNKSKTFLRDVAVDDMKKHLIMTCKVINSLMANNSFLVKLKNFLVRESSMQYSKPTVSNDRSHAKKSSNPASRTPIRSKKAVTIENRPDWKEQLANLRKKIEEQ